MSRNKGIGAWESERGWAETRRECDGDLKGGEKEQKLGPPHRLPLMPQWVLTDP